MINRNHRILASLLLCVMVFSVLVVPISYSQKPNDANPGRLAALWLALTAALDVLDAIERFIGIITKDLKEMEDAVAEANDKLRLELYPEKDKRKEEIGDLQKELDKLNSEEADALSKRSNAEGRIRSLKGDISQAEADLGMLGPYEYSARQALEHHISMLKSSLESAKQDVKNANKIINSNWRALKRSYYQSTISRLETLLNSQVQSEIARLEAQTDALNPHIKKKREELEAQEPGRAAAQAEVDKKRAEYKKAEEEENAKKKGNP